MIDFVREPTTYAGYLRKYAHEYKVCGNDERSDTLRESAELIDYLNAEVAKLNESTERLDKLHVLARLECMSKQHRINHLETKLDEVKKYVQAIFRALRSKEE